MLGSEQKHVENRKIDKHIFPDDEQWMNVNNEKDLQIYFPDDVKQWMKASTEENNLQIFL